MNLEDDADLRDPSRVGRRLGELGLYEHLGGRVRALCTVRELLALSRAARRRGLRRARSLRARALARRTHRRRRADDDGRAHRRLRADRAGSGQRRRVDAHHRTQGRRVVDSRRRKNAHLERRHRASLRRLRERRLRGRKERHQRVLRSRRRSKASSSCASRSRDITRSGASCSRRAAFPTMRSSERSAHGLSLALGTLGIFRTSVGAAAIGMAWRALEETIAHVNRARSVRTRSSPSSSSCKRRSPTWRPSSTPRAFSSRAPRTTSKRSIDADCAPNENGRRVVDGEDASDRERATHHRSRGAAPRRHGRRRSASKVEELYREIRPLRIYEGATDVLKLIIAQSVLKRAARHDERALLAARASGG